MTIRKTLVFDLGGVLIDWNPRYLYRNMFADAGEMEYFLSEVCSPEWNATTDGERSFQDAIEELLPEYPQYRDQINAYHQRWEEMIGGLIPGSVELLEELKQADHPLAALSNWSSETFPLVQSKYEFLDWFDPLIISGHVGYIKPHRQIFEILIDALDRDPGKCIYIDDRMENVQAAAGLGFKTFHFSSAEGLRRDLRSRGLLQ